MLSEHIEDIREGVRSNRFTNEASVSQGIVLRLLSALGWPTYDTRVVAPEYPLEGRRVDFALCHPAPRPLVFIEVKKVGQGDGGERQLFEYAFHRGIPFAILTDGNEWQFFLPGEAGEYGERRLYHLDLTERDVDESVRRFERYLGHDRVCSGQALVDARADYQDVARDRLVREALPRAWAKLVEEEDEYVVLALSEYVEILSGYKPDPDTIVRFLAERLAVRPAVSAGASAPLPALVPTQMRQVAATPSIRQPVAATEGAPALGGERGQVPVHLGYALGGPTVPCRTAKDVLVGVFDALVGRDPGFADRFMGLPRHGRKRRYLARTAEELYPGRPDLAAEVSEQLRSGYWVGTNAGHQAIERILRMACEAAGLRYGVDLKVSLGG